MDPRLVMLCFCLLTSFDGRFAGGAVVKWPDKEGVSNHVADFLQNGKIEKAKTEPFGIENTNAEQTILNDKTSADLGEPVPQLQTRMKFNFPKNIGNQFRSRVRQVSEKPFVNTIVNRFQRKSPSRSSSGSSPPGGRARQTNQVRMTQTQTQVLSPSQARSPAGPRPEPQVKTTPPRQDPNRRPALPSPRQDSSPTRGPPNPGNEPQTQEPKVEHIRGLSSLAEPSDKPNLTRSLSRMSSGSSPARELAAAQAVADYEAWKKQEMKKKPYRNPLLAIPFIGKKDSSS